MFAPRTSAHETARTGIHRLGRTVVLSAGLVGAGIVLAGPASAHVSISPDSGAAGEFTVATVAVPHGCDGSATTKVTISVPKELNSITPTRNPLYTVTKRIEKLAVPIEDAHGNEITERDAQVVYTATTPLPDGYRDAFELSFQVPDAPGSTIYFPTIQTCENGSTAWVEIAPEGADEPEHPAPSFEVLPAADRGNEPAVATDASPAASTRPASSSTGSSGPNDGLALAGVGAGVVGLALGGTALARTRRRA